MRTDLALERDQDGNWKPDPYISVNHDDPLTDEQAEAFRELGRAVRGRSRVKPKTWAELERFAGIERTVPPAFTQRDVRNLTLKRLGRSPFWKKKR